MKCLLLNNAYEFLELITIRKAIKHIINEKVEVMHLWDEEDKFSPATIRLKKYVKPRLRNLKCTRENIFKRDGYRCQYCKFAPANSKELEMEHIIPSSLGGKTSFQNCVTACHSCNCHKANRTPDQVGFKLIKEPKIPKFSFEYLLRQGPYFPDWDIYVPK